jgi:hypothetical protein
MEDVTMGEERRAVNREYLEKVHGIELMMTKHIGQLEAAIKVLEIKLLEMNNQVGKLHKTFYGTFIAAFLTYIFDKFF